MDSFWNNWAHAHRNAKAMGTVVLLVLMLTWALFSWPPERVELRHIKAQVLESQPAKSPTGMGRLLLQMEDGRKLKLYVSPRPFPATGETVPLILELYEDGSRIYLLDQLRWQDYKLTH